MIVEVRTLKKFLRETRDLQGIKERWVDFKVSYTPILKIIDQNKNNVINYK